ncbi:hypothetical protein K504DRAFT_456012 [Pleomassaria siparia CBS 279.74]|uniref:Uncharacterized protein n=1 Tax=Pleomassaria siparia CBS 279.74 TaxID=1314801 RepID=A0A6G1K916_9PLEO|nr:hypothetical protein K504DRAFT_456012 [Pleomassaria siparia CBS 279.74]
MSLGSYYRKYFIVEVYINITLRYLCRFIVSAGLLCIGLLGRDAEARRGQYSKRRRLSIVKGCVGYRYYYISYFFYAYLLYTLLDSGPYIEYTPYSLTVYLFTFNNNSVLQNLNNATLLSS